MEDLDHPKVKPGAALEAMQDLRWLGLDWDEGPDCGGPHSPYIQSERIDCYREALGQLQGRDLVYACICARSDVESTQSAPHVGEDGFYYPGTCRDQFTGYDDACEHLPGNRLPAWRFRTYPAEVTFTDAFHDKQSCNVHDTIGDFTIARHRDGAGYMLAVVVDDAAMDITEVMRGNDLLAATHRQILLQDALGLPRPVYVHVPLVVGPDGRRLAKRHGDTRVSAFRDAGVKAERIVGLLAHWCGWADEREELMPADLLERFSLDSIPQKPIVCNEMTTEVLLQ